VSKKKGKLPSWPILRRAGEGGALRNYGEKKKVAGEAAVRATGSLPKGRRQKKKTDRACEKEEEKIWTHRPKKEKSSRRRGP